MVPDVQIRTEIDKRQKRLQLTRKANFADKPTHRNGFLRAVRVAILSHPMQTQMMCDGTGCLNQLRGIHVQILATMKITQKTDTPEQITNEMFKRQFTRPLSINLDTRRCEKFEFNLISNMRSGFHHIIKSEDQSIIRQHLGLCRVNCLTAMIIMRGEAFDFVELTLPAFVSKSDPLFPYLIEGKHHPR